MKINIKIDTPTVNKLITDPNVGNINDVHLKMIYFKFQLRSFPFLF